MSEITITNCSLCGQPMRASDWVALYKSEAERYRAALEKAYRDLDNGSVRIHVQDNIREALHPTQPIQAHSKSEYKRLSAQGVDVIPPAEGSEKI